MLKKYYRDFSAGCAAGASEGRRSLWVPHAAAIFGSGAVLGPLCDGLHSQHGVLYYAEPVLLQMPAAGFQLETCWCA